MKLPLILRAVAILPAIFVMYIIFSYSAQPELESKNSSNAISGPLIETFFGVNDMDYTEDTVEYYETFYIDAPIRKTAHMLEYATLCVAVIIALVAWNAGPIEEIKKVSIRFTCLYAASDEFHQLFVPGRAGSPIDVFIDCMGAVFGTAIMFAVLKWLVELDGIRANGGKINEHRKK